MESRLKPLLPISRQGQITLVQRGHLRIQRRLVAAVVDHVVGDGQAFRTVGLLGQHTPGQRLVDAVATAARA